MKIGSAPPVMPPISGEVQGRHATNPEKAEARLAEVHAHRDEKRDAKKANIQEHRDTMSNVKPEKMAAKREAIQTRLNDKLATLRAEHPEKYEGMKMAHQAAGETPVPSVTTTQTAPGQVFDALA